MTAALPDVVDRLADVALPALRRASPVDTGKLSRSWALTSEGFSSSAPYMPFVMATQAARVVEDSIADVIPAFEADTVALVERATESL
jgi:hypothetical protein